jgi:hypothetical protein
MFVKTYGIYIGYDFISVASRNSDSPVVTPLFIHPLHRTMDRQKEIVKAFNKIISGKHILAGKSSYAMLSFESSENMVFVTDASDDVPDVREMMSWELLIRCGKSVKDYNISSVAIASDKRLVAASKKKEIEFYTKQIERFGIKTINIEPSIASGFNLFEQNYDASAEALVAISSCHKLSMAYVKNENLIDIAQYTIRRSELISSEDIMKLRAEISERNSIEKEVPLYVTGDLLADREYSDLLIADLVNCSYLDPFKMIVPHEKSNKNLMEKYSLVFGVAVSLSNKMV